MENEHADINRGTIPTGSGKLVTITGTIRTTTTVTTPIVLGDGNHVLTDNETNAVITAGNGNNLITEIGTGASIVTGNGENVIDDLSGGAMVTTGTGDAFINLGGVGNSVTVGPAGGGWFDVSVINAGGGTATVKAGNGNMDITASGAANTITAGNGIDVINLGRAIPAGGPGRGIFDAPVFGAASATIPVTADKVTLGNGINAVFLGGSGNTVYDGSGTDTITGAAGGKDRFVVNAAGGTVAISGFSLSNGDALDLTSILAGVSLAPDLSNLGSFVALSTRTEGWHSHTTDTTLTIKGASGTASVTLLNSGSLSLTGLETASLVLPAH